MSARPVRRAFVDIEHGQIHCRIAGAPAAAKQPPLLMLHGGPGSSAGLLPMIRALSDAGSTVIAPDMMGNGESDPPPVEPDFAFYVECIVLLLDRLGVGQVDCYGHHVGAQIACELAIRAPRRLRRLVLDGIGLFSADQRHEFMTRYAPPIVPDSTGQHVAQLWAFLSATTMRFPHYSEDERDRIPGGMPLPPAALTDLLATVARNWRTYHLSYLASFAEDFAARLQLVRHPATVLKISTDPLAVHAATAVARLFDGRMIEVERDGRADSILKIMNAKES